MKTLHILVRGLAAFALTAPLFATTVPISASASYLGLTSNWQFSYNAGASDLYLQQIMIDLSPTNVRFDTAPGGFGSLGSADVVANPGATGLNNTYAHGAALDGASNLSFTFATFQPGDTFSFTADLDHPNPVLAPLNQCGPLTGLARTLCLLNNAVITASNNGLLIVADTVLSSQVAGAVVTFQFGGPNYDPVSLQTTLQAATLQNIISGLSTGEGTRSFAAGNTAATPEPGTLLPAGGCIGLLGLYLRRRRA